MGEIVEFPSNGSTAQGYLAVPEGGGGLPLVVIQEWWGLVPHIQDVCDRFAAEGFVALAPDLFHGETASEPDEAGKLMMALNVEQAARDMSGAVDKVAEVAGSDRVGVTGFCMGGGLALVVAARRPDKVKAVVPWYGLIPWPNAEPDWSQLDAKVLGHYAGNDGFFGPDQVARLQQTFDELGKDARLHVVPGADHAFFNDTRPEVHDPEASQACFAETVDFLRATLG
ncbi:MAG TPA: dienelactone hydrolase family protein [Acidimicrobiales bacterium]|nr:dienelactone hydrolase family protein [Acidimicrobiales bacterium]